MKAITILRWGLVPVASILGIIMGLLSSMPLNHFIHFILWSSGHAMPGKIFLAYVLPYDGAITMSLFILSGYFAAPTCRRTVAFLLLLVGSLFTWAWLGEFVSSIHYVDGPHRIWWPIIGTYLGGIITFAVLSITSARSKS